MCVCVCARARVCVCVCARVRACGCVLQFRQSIADLNIQLEAARQSAKDWEVRMLA